LVIRFTRLLLSGHQAIVIENAALRLQLAASAAPQATGLDRFRSTLLTTLRSLWSGWRGPLLYVQPDTVVRWQRERIRSFWTRL
jgi:hypothetical protein